MRKAMPDAEFRLWRELRHRGIGPRFRRQHPIGPYIADFFCAEARLIVEVDGEQHAGARQSEYDLRRTRWLEEQGYTVIRIWTNEVLNDLDAVCAAILAACRGAWDSPPPESR
jgi:very-short-patch-repair endonuclease